MGEAAHDRRGRRRGVGAVEPAAHSVSSPRKRGPIGRHALLRHGSPPSRVTTTRRGQSHGQVSSPAKSPSSPARRAASAAASRCCWRRRAPASWSATSARASKAPAPTPGRRRRWSTRSRPRAARRSPRRSRSPSRRTPTRSSRPRSTAFGRVDILVNNAGILRDRIFHRMSWSDWSDVLAVHLNGSFNMSRACAVQFREQNSGAFVHMTSTSALVGNFGQANYMAAKFGIVGLSRGIALDMQRFKVRSNCIAPFAWTRMINSIPAETPEEKARVERFQQMTPEKIAPLTVYLALRPRRGHLRADLRRAQQRDFPVQPAAAGAHHPSLRRLDAREARPAAQGRVRRLVHAARALHRRVLVGSGVTYRRLPRRAAA